VIRGYTKAQGSTILGTITLVLENAPKAESREVAERENICDHSLM